MSDSSLRQRPGRFVFAALILTLVLAGVLGMNVMVTSRYHLSVAEGVLRDYAGFAAEELESRVQFALAQRLFPIVSTLGTRGGTSETVRLMPPETLLASLDSTVRRAVAGRMTVFRLVPGRPLHTVGPALGAGVMSRLADSLPSRAAAVLSRSAYFGLFWLDDTPEPLVAAFNAGADSASGRVIYGFVLPTNALQPLLLPAIHRAPLLPASLTGGIRLDSAVTYRVATPSGAALVESAQSSSGFSSRRSLAPMWGGISVEAALRPSLAPRLVIGGLPRSRLPIVLALLGLTAVLVVTALIQLRRERELARVRDEFVASASHEFRTPLAQIRLFTETLRLGRVRNDAERTRSLEIIDQESRRLSHLVENLLYASRAGRGVLSIAPRRLNVAAALRDAVDGFEPLAAARNNTVAVVAPDQLEAEVDGDAFRQIVLNLLDNAVKYGPQGQQVTATLSSHNGSIRLTVDDQGPGIPAPERQRVFRRFVRLDRDKAANTTGTGLGLALVQELAAMHRGRARAESGPDGGARVVVEWPAGSER